MYIICKDSKKVSGALSRCPITISTEIKGKLPVAKRSFTTGI